MSILSKIKSLIPASSRSLHAMHHELGQMHGQMGQMWAEVGESRYMLYDVLARLNALEDIVPIKRSVEAMDNRHMVMLWELYRREGESLPDAKRRMLTGFDHASGNLRLYQLASAQLLAEFDAFCAAHDLRYWLVSGTLLGAVRHEGFIPWDDDLDVGMTRQDIERIIELVKDDERYEVTVRYDWYVNCRQVRFRYADTMVPCFVDLFYFDPVTKYDKESLVAREEEREALEADLRADETYADSWNADKQFVEEGTTEAEPVAAHFRRHVDTLYERGVLTSSLDEAEALIWAIDNVNSGVAHHSWYLIPKKAIFPLGRMAFEKDEVSVPADYDRCLRDIFGDYWDLPHTVGSYFDHLLGDALRDEQVQQRLKGLSDRYTRSVEES